MTRRAALPALAVALAAAVVAALWLGPWVLAAVLPLAGLVLLAALRPLRSAPPVSRELPGPQAVAALGEPLRSRARAALREARAVLAALEAMPVAPPGLADQVVALAGELVAAAARADRCDRYLARVDRNAIAARLQAAGRDAVARQALADQLDAVDALLHARAALDDELAEVEASLGAMRARALEAAATGGAPAGLGVDVRGLRDDVRAVAEALSEVRDDGGRLPP